MSAVARWDPARLAPAEDDVVKCVACGLCLPHCPTFRLTGRETASPRGRIAAMRAVEEGHGEVDASFTTMMDECLACRACEAACPSGVPFGRMIEAARAQAEPTRAAPARGVRRLGLAGSSRGRRLVLAAGWLLAAARALRLDRLAPPAQRASTPPATLREMLRPDPRERWARARRRRSWPGASWTSPTGPPSARRCAPWPRPATGPCAPPRAAAAARWPCTTASPRPRGAMARERIPELEARRDRRRQRLGVQRPRARLRGAARRRPRVGRARRARRGQGARPDRAGAARARPPPRARRGARRLPPPARAAHRAARDAAARRRRVRRPRRRRPLLRRRRPLQRPAAGSSQGGCGARRPRRSPRPARRSSPSPTRAARSRSRPASRRSGRRRASRTPPSWWRPGR